MRRSAKGFIIWPLLMLFAGGAFIAIMTGLQRVPDDEEKKAATLTVLEEVVDALAHFRADNGRLPCPAPRNIAPDQSTFGVESNCALPHVGIVDVSGVLIGLLPFKTLNLRPSSAMDAWGHHILYAMSSDLGTAMEGNDALIDVRDEAGNSLLAVPSSAAFVVLSHGPNGKGAFSFYGSSQVPCDASSLEGDNCNDDGVFVTTELLSPSIEYDDIIRWRLKF